MSKTMVLERRGAVVNQSRLPDYTQPEYEKKLREQINKTKDYRHRMEVMTDEDIQTELERQFPDKVIRKITDIRLPKGTLSYAANRHGLGRNDFLRKLGFDVCKLWDETRVIDELVKMFPDKVISVKVGQLDFFPQINRVARRRLITVTEFLQQFGFQIVRGDKQK